MAQKSCHSSPTNVIRSQLQVQFYTVPRAFFYRFLRYKSGSITYHTAILHRFYGINVQFYTVPHGTELAEQTTEVLAVRGTPLDHPVHS